MNNSPIKSPQYYQYMHAGKIESDNGGIQNPEVYLQDCAEIIANHSIDINEEKMLDLVGIRYRWTVDRMAVIDNANNDNLDFFDFVRVPINRQMPGEGISCINYDRWKKYYDWGFTTIFFDVLDLTRDLRELDEKLKPLKGSKTLGNFYLSKGTRTVRPSFDLHTHDYHVIVKPIYGKVRWIIDGKEVIADPTKVLVIPAYTEHQVIESREPKLSLTLNLST